MDRAPAISVIMPVYNGAALLPATLDSLWAQTFGDFELVVVDDGSTDGTRELLSAQTDPRVRAIFAETNGGPVIARNRAVAAARGRYIAALDADDLCLPTRFEKQVALLDARPDVAMAASAIERLMLGRLHPSSVPAVTTPGFIDWLLRFTNPIAWSTVMIRAEAARNLDPFMRPERLYAEDFDFHHRIRAHGRIARIDEVLLHYRHDPGSISRTHRDTVGVQSRAVLAEVNAGLWDAADAAAVARHVMLQDPVTDAETLTRVVKAIARLPLPEDAESRALAVAHRATMWRKTARAGVRSGTVPLAAALALRPVDAAKPRPVTLAEWAAVGMMRLAANRRGDLAYRLQRVAPAVAACAVL